jgi:dolichyl-phosphate-mannose--protein O-mannosyl transferase
MTDAQGTAGYIALGIITALAFFTRFYKLDHPNEVVFDEVHFGKFASYVSFHILPERKHPATLTGGSAKPQSRP